MPRTCPDAESLFLYSEGLLEGEDHAQVASHLATCAACRERVRAESELTVSLRSLALPEPTAPLGAAVRTRIMSERRRRRAPYWWGAIAAAFLVASGVRWLLVADLSPQGAGLAVLELVLFIVRSPFALVGWLTDPETWGTAATVTTSLAVAVTSSPAMVALMILAALAVATAVNVALFGALRRLTRA